MKIDALRFQDEFPVDIAHYDPNRLMVRGLIQHAIKSVLSGEKNIIAIDGRPGVGKTSNVEVIANALRERMIPVTILGTDEDLIERDSREGLELIEFHTGELVREAVAAHMDPRFEDSGARIKYDAYTSKTGRRSENRIYDIPNRNGVLMIEGVRASEHVIDVIKKMRSEAMSRVLFILMEKSPDLINAQRFVRDVRDKGLDPDEVLRRIATQERHLRAYFGDLGTALRKRGRFERVGFNGTRLNVGELK